MSDISLPTEPIGSIPRPLALVQAIGVSGDGPDPALGPLYEAAIRDTMANTSPDGFRIPFSGGHTRRMPRLTAGPFRYVRYADQYLDMELAAAVL